MFSICLYSPNQDCQTPLWEGGYLAIVSSLPYMLTGLCCAVLYLWGHRLFLPPLVMSSLNSLLCWAVYSHLTQYSTVQSNNEFSLAVCHYFQRPGLGAAPLWLQQKTNQFGNSAQAEPWPSELKWNQSKVRKARFMVTKHIFKNMI